MFFNCVECTKHRCAGSGVDIERSIPPLLGLDYGKIQLTYTHLTITIGGPLLLEHIFSTRTDSNAINSDSDEFFDEPYIRFCLLW